MLEHVDLSQMTFLALQDHSLCLFAVDEERLFFGVLTGDHYFEFGLVAQRHGISTNAHITGHSERCAVDGFMCVTAHEWLLRRRIKCDPGWAHRLTFFNSFTCPANLILSVLKRLFAAKERSITDILVWHSDV